MWLMDAPRPKVWKSKSRDQVRESVNKVAGGTLWPILSIRVPVVLNPQIDISLYYYQIF